MVTRIDSHHHLWHYDPGEYGWIDDSMRVLRRDFLPDSLSAVLQPAGVHGSVAVQARQSLEETTWLLDLARQNDFLKGVVGWVPLIQPDVAGVLAPLAKQPKLRAVRHVLQSEPDPDYMLREDFNRGIATLRQFGLAYDILIYERHLPQTIRFVDRHPDQVFILDHGAKPRIRERVLSPWREDMVELSRRPNLFCKVSGLATEAEWQHWKDEDLDPYWDTLLQAFGPNRLMFGSDWPVCLVATHYQRWVDYVAARVARLSATEHERIWSGTAIEAYGLS